MRFFAWRRLAVASGAALCLGCDETLAGDGGPVADAYVNLGENFFSPQNVAIRAGQSVLWSWGGGSHDMYFTSPGAPASCPLATAGVCVRRFPTVGTFSYVCNPHAGVGMVGSVRVDP